MIGPKSGMWFDEEAENYYSVEAADELLSKPLPEGFVWWRCVLCGYPLGVPKENNIGAYCCGGCGMTCLRPIEEFGTPKTDLEEKCDFGGSHSASECACDPYDGTA